MKIQFNLILFTCICIIGVSTLSCQKETIVETEIITETIIDTVFIPKPENVTRFILIRHAEKSSIGTDPNLTSEGDVRAENIAHILSKIELDLVYSTNFNRTLQTAMPTANDQGLSITNYEGLDHDQVIDDILENTIEGKILIVGHSNTTPNFLNTLTGTLDYTDIPEDEFDNLFIVDLRSIGDSDVIHLKY